MLFNSFEFIFLFLPIVFSIYFLLNKINLNLYARIWLVFSSLFYYSYWKFDYLALILISIIVNFILGNIISNLKSNKKFFLISGILFNILLLGYYKYYDFFIENINYLFSTSFPLLKKELPLGISFFTFQQIAYLVDSYKQETREYNFFSYSLFVSFFPQLIAGPIVHHKEMMPQFDSKENQKLNYQNISSGIFIFSLGLFKKVILADNISLIADTGYNHSQGIHLIDAWLSLLAFLLQIYFDFSGYSDMAVGLGRIFNIHIVWNFNSPFKSPDIQEFWRRWHMSLSRFLRDYIYIPLGGSKVSEFRNYFNIFITFVIGGIWHGAGWTFLIWGTLTGIGIVIHKIWKEKLKMSMTDSMGIICTFLFTLITSVFFRANSVKDALEILKGASGINGIILPEFLKNIAPDHFTYLELGSQIFQSVHKDSLSYLILGLILVFFTKNSIELSRDFKPTLKFLVFSVFLFVISILNLSKIEKFIYFNF